MLLLLFQGLTDNVHNVVRKIIRGSNIILIFGDKNLRTLCKLNALDIMDIAVSVGLSLCLI